MWPPADWPCWLVASALCACGGAAPTAAPSRPAISQRTAPASENEALRLDWDDLGWAFEIPMLPAISADGTMIVIAKSEPFRGEPYITGRHPSLELMVMTRGDTVAKHLRVLSADEADSMFDAGGMKPELRARVVDANRWLAEIDRRYHLVALESLEVVRALDMPSHVRSHAVGSGITVDWVAGQLEVVQRHEPGGPKRTVVRATTAASWLVPDHPTRCATSSPSLEMVYGDAAHEVIVVEIGYGGVDPDNCTRPPNQIHVVAW